MTEKEQIHGDDGEYHPSLCLSCYSVNNEVSSAPASYSRISWRDTKCMKLKMVASLITPRGFIEGTMVTDIFRYNKGDIHYI